MKKTPKTLGLNADNKYSSFSFYCIGGQNYDRMMEATFINVSTCEKALINVISLWQPKDAASPDITMLLSRPLRATRF